MILDSEAQRKLLLDRLRQVPMQVLDGQGRPVVPNLGNFEDGLPEKEAALMKAVREASVPNGGADNEG